MNARVEANRNPLEGWASILAVRDIRQRLQQQISLGDQGHRPWEERLLALDPLTVLRCMRVAHSPVYDLSRELLTIPQLCKALGRAMVRRALNTPACDVAGTEPVRRLWLHSVATAHAARSLALASGEYDPEKAYVLGLLHDLPLWLHYLALRQSGSAPKISAVDWVRHWNLPKQFGKTIEQIALGCTNTPSSTPTDAASLVSAAETLAELADFWHPDAGDPTTRELMLSMVTREDLVSRPLAALPGRTPRCLPR